MRSRHLSIRNLHSTLYSRNRIRGQKWRGVYVYSGGHYSSFPFDMTFGYSQILVQFLYFIRKSTFSGFELLSFVVLYRYYIV